MLAKLKEIEILKECTFQPKLFTQITQGFTKNRVQSQQPTSRGNEDPQLK